MDKLISLQLKKREEVRFDNKVEFTLPVEGVEKKFRDEPFILALGIEQFGFLLPEGHLEFEGNSYKLIGYWVVVEICISTTDKVLNFTYTSPSGVADFIWWYQRKESRNTGQRLFINLGTDTKYNAALHAYFSLKCNFTCSYCFVESNSREHKLRKIEIDKFLNVLKQTGKIFHIVFSGGEPLIIPNIIEACVALSGEHYISIISNLVLTKKIKKFSTLLKPERVKFIIASFHINELENRNLIDEYIDNYKLLKNCGFSISAQTVGHPVLLDSIKKYMEIFAKHDLKLTCAPFIGEYNNKKYPQSYTEDQLRALKYKGELVETAYAWYGKKCTAGFNNGVIKNSNGDVYSCMHIDDKIGNIYEGIDFKNKMISCPKKFCSLPLSIEDYSLYIDALREEHENPVQ